MDGWTNRQIDIQLDTQIAVLTVKFSWYFIYLLLILILSSICISPCVITYHVRQVAADAHQNGMDNKCQNHPTSLFHITQRGFVGKNQPLLFLDLCVCHAASETHSFCGSVTNIYCDIRYTLRSKFLPRDKKRNIIKLVIQTFLLFLINTFKKRTSIVHEWCHSYAIVRQLAVNPSRVCFMFAALKESP